MAGIRAARAGCWVWALVATVAASAALAAATGALAAEAIPPAGGGLSSEAGSALMQPVGAAQQAAEEEAAKAARLSSPEALAEDARSRLEYSGYGRAASIGLAKRLFGIGDSASNMPQDQGAAKITSYLNEDVAAETLPDGKHLLLDSSMPLRSAIGSGQLAPVSLSLASTGPGYEPVNPLVPVVIAKNAAEGVSFEPGLRVAPVQHAEPESSEVVGDAVYFHAAAKATDFILEPQPAGVEAAWQILSAEASGEDALNFTLPQGASLVLSHRIPGGAEVLLEGRRLLSVMSPSVTQANGASVPASYSVSGSTLTVHVDLSGNLDFPLMIDPLITQEYGGGSLYWDGWGESGTSGVYFLGGGGNEGVLAGLLENYGNGAWAAREIYAPGWSTGEGSIARVDVRGLEHYYGEATHLETGIVGENAYAPVWTFNGTNPAETQSGQLNTGAWIPASENKAAAFCAVGAGGYDGGPTPLCNENEGGAYYHLSIYGREPKPYTQWVEVNQNWVKFLDTSNIKAAASTAAEVGGTNNVLSDGGWLSEASGAFEAIGSDPAFGVESLTVWVHGPQGSDVWSRNVGSEGYCDGVVCPGEVRDVLTYKNFRMGLPEGEDTVEVRAADRSGLTGTWTAPLRVDKKPPHNIAVSGADVNGETINITEGQAGDQITAEATDGENGAPSSGIESLEIEVDEHQIGAAEGSCQPGPCTAKATWTLNGRELGAGVHALTVIATDRAGNKEYKNYELVVNAAAPLAIGPGSVNPQSGDFALESTDVDLKDSAGDLVVTQHYDSRNVKEGAEGPLGPEWSIGLGQLASLEVMESEGKIEGVMVVGSEGLSYFPFKEGVYESPPGDASLSLRLVNSGSEYILEDKKKGTSTTFTHPAGAKKWMPTISKTAVATNTLTDTYKSVEVNGKTIVEPTEELAPHGSEACPPKATEMHEGCRALLFLYGDEGSGQPEAKGEGESEWGWYANRLTKVVAATWSTAAKEMQEVPVAEFAYDGQGRLRAEWDPRVKPALKTTYGYNSEDEVTALSPPGQQPWLMTYGTIPGDASAGRLIKVRRLQASTALWGGQLPVNGESPTITGVVAAGNRLAVSVGKWSDEHVAYGFQWKRCNASGGECVLIAGANNTNYTPSSEDVGHRLEAQVSATNAGGTTTASAVSTVVASSAPASFVNHTESPDADSSIDAVSCVVGSSDCVVGDGSGNALYATNVSAKSGASWQSWAGPGTSPSDALTCPGTGLCLLADGSGDEGKGNLYYATSLGGAWTEAYSPAYGVDAISCVSTAFCLDGQDGGGYFRYSTSPASSSWSLLEQGAGAMKGVSCLSAAFCAIADSKGSVHVATSESAVKSSSWTETSVDDTALNGIACTSASSCVAVDTYGNVMTLAVNGAGAVTSAHGTDVNGGSALTAITCTTGSVCAAVGSNGDLFVSTDGGSTWSKPDTLGGDLTSVSCASASLCVTASTTGVVTAFDPTEEASKEEGASQSPQPGATIEYDVPVSGSGAPYAMGAKEVEEWGQKEDVPAEAAEIFPEEHPQGWPASGHTGATVYYTDDEAQAVNVANPSGGISTTEYYEGDVVRALSADNRERALKEANPVEVAEKLSTVSKYSEEGDELSEVTGPEHKVKLSNGEEVDVRNHVRYFYDEGAPENEKGEVEEYGLVTKTTDGALLADGEERDVRTTLTGYSGQEGLGWTLRLPTSTTTEPRSVDLISSTKYNPVTGAVEETHTPGGNAETVSPPEPAFRFGTEGSGAGQMKMPSDVTIGPEGDAYVTDEQNNRIDKYAAKGEFIEAITVSYEERGLSDPKGIAIDPATGDIFVADTGNNRVLELAGTGKVIDKWPDAAEIAIEKETKQSIFAAPVGVAMNGAGDVFVSNYESDEVVELEPKKSDKEEWELVTGGFGSKGTGAGQFEGPDLMTVSQGVLYVSDLGNKRIEMFSAATRAYLGQFGTAGREPGEFEEPAGIAADPATGDLYIADEKDQRMEEYSPSGKYLGEFGWWGNGENELEGPAGVAVNAAGTIYIADRYNNRISVWTQAEAGGAHMTYSTQFGTEGNGEGKFEYPSMPAVDSDGHVWVGDYGDDQLQEFSPQGKFLASYGSPGQGDGQFERITGLAINQATNDMYVGDEENHRIQELGPKGEFIRAFTSAPLNSPGGIAIDTAGNVWVTDMSSNEIEEFSATGTFLHAYGKTGSGELQFNRPVGIAVVGETVYVADDNNNRIEKISTTGQYLGQISREGSNGGEMKNPEDIAANSAGDLFVEDTGNDRIDEFSPSGHYLETVGRFGEGDGELRWPQGIAMTAAGDMYVTDPGNHRVEKWVPDSQAAHDTRTVYYSRGSESGVEACEDRPQWAGLLCRTEPVAQPTDSAAEPKSEQLPELPVITTEYNMWYEPVKKTEAFGSTTRTKTIVYEGERPVSESTQAGGSDAVVPPVSFKYSATLGMLVEQSSEAKTTTRQLNTLGQLESYTDAAGNTTAYGYDQYGRLVEVDYNASKLDQMEARQTLHYDEATGAVTELQDLGGEGTYGGQGAGAFRASYDVEGNILSESYPNDMTATYAYNSVGEGTSLSYVKSSHCAGSECEWFKDTLTPSIHGEAMSQTSSLASEQYRYQQPGGLAEVQETPAGEGCVTRVYAYNEEADRTSLTARKPAFEGKCASEGGEAERHTYDEANRLTDEEVQYESLGNITRLPAVDAGGHALETEYYADGQVHSQTQDEKTNTYTLDPEGRPLSTETVGKELVSEVVVSHYDGPGGGAPSWTYSQTTGSWSRNIVGFGGLVAVEESGKQAVLQIRDLEGDIVGTASLSESEGKPLTLERTTEFGVPISEKPADPYGWLGASGLTSNLSGGAIVQDGATYVPQLGAALQTTSPALPAAPLSAVTPVVITVAPYVPVKYIEASSKAGGGGTPGGNIPEPEGEVTAGGEESEEEAGGEFTFDPRLNNCNMEVNIDYVATEDTIFFENSWECRRYDKQQHQYIDLKAELYGYDTFGTQQSETFSATGWKGVSFREIFILPVQMDIPFSEVGVCFKVRLLGQKKAKWDKLSCFKTPVPPDLAGPPEDE